MSKIGIWLDERLFNNRYNLPDINELLNIIYTYYPGYSPITTYKELTPDKLWERVHSFLDIPPSDAEGAGEAMNDMLEKMSRSSWAYEYFKRRKNEENR